MLYGCSNGDVREMVGYGEMRKRAKERNEKEERLKLMEDIEELNKIKYSLLQR